MVVLLVCRRFAQQRSCSCAKHGRASPDLGKQQRTRRRHEERSISRLFVASDAVNILDEAWNLISHAAPASRNQCPGFPSCSRSHAGALILLRAPLTCALTRSSGCTVQKPSVAVLSAWRPRAWLTKFELEDL